MSLKERIAQLSQETGIPQPTMETHQAEEVSMMREAMNFHATLLEKLRATGMVKMIEEMTGTIEQITTSEISETINSLTTPQRETYGTPYLGEGWRVDRFQLLMGVTADGSLDSGLHLSVIEQFPDDPRVVRQVLVTFSTEEFATISGGEGLIFEDYIPVDEHERIEVLELALARAFILPREIESNSLEYYTP